MSEVEFRAATCAEVVRILAAERKVRGLSMNQLAKKAGMTQPMISILESSQPNPKLDSLLKISRALDLSLDRVLAKALRQVTKRAQNVPNAK